MRNQLYRCLSGAYIAVACLAGSAVHAQSGASGPGFYVGAAIGGSSYKVDTGSLASVGFATTGKDDGDFAWNLTAGYKFTRNLAVEVGYVDLGRFSATGTFGGAPARIDADITGWNVSGVGTLPLNDMFSVYGKFGFFRSEASASANVAGAVGRGSSHQNDITAGIGARYHLNRNVSVLLEANYYGLGDNDNAWAYLLGARYDF